MAARRRGRRTDKELFLETLSSLSGSGTKNVVNGNMITELNWEPEKYLRIKKQLQQEEKISIGPGRGGSVALASPEPAKPISLFISYSHIDEDVKNELIKHLEPLKRMNLINTWHDRKINAGQEWNGEISRELKSADIIILLISIDFINSKYCYDTELELAMERHDKKLTEVIPVIVRNCIWSACPFAKLQAVPRNGSPIRSWSNSDDAYVNVAEEIKKVAEELREITSVGM